MLPSDIPLILINVHSFPNGVCYNKLYNMKEMPQNFSPLETQSLNPEALARVHEENSAESERYSTTHIYTIEKTTTFDTSINISYGGLSQQLPLEVKDQVQPGTKILVVTDEENFMVLKGTYVLGENLREKGNPS